MKDCERNILPDPISGQEAFDKLVEHILGKDWYVVMPMSRDQVNNVALEEIKDKYDRLSGKKLKDDLKNGWNNFLKGLMLNGK